MRKLVTPPVRLPVFLAEAKAEARIDIDVEDALIDAWLTEATAFAQDYTGRQFINATYDFYFDAFPMCRDDRGEYSITLDRAPLVSVSSVGYLDANEAEQVMDTDDYRVDIVSEPGRIVLKSTANWPTTAAVSNAVFVRAVVGYGSNPGDVPEPIRQWLRQQAVYRHALRSRTVLGVNGAIDLPAWMGVDALTNYRVAWL